MDLAMAQRTITLIPTDPLFGVQWHLNNTGQIAGAVAGYDINVIGVWPDYTGQGVVVAVLDDGFDQTHPDLIANYRADLSWDFVLDIPGAQQGGSDAGHGTAVAGLIGASVNNQIGGVGVAWDATLIGYRSLENRLIENFSKAVIRMLDADADISSNSWSTAVSAFATQSAQPSFVESTLSLATIGREGLGTVVLFSAGNDRAKVTNNTNYDPSTNIPYAIVVAAGKADGLITSYSTPGASVLVTAPGSEPDSIVTTDWQGADGYNKSPGEAGNYTDRASDLFNIEDTFFNGTSASAPIAAGVVALMLEANARLGYRDIQEILVYSSKRAVFLDAAGVPSDVNQAVDWNGGGLLTGYDFGFGNIDAHAAVRLAESWQKTSTTNNLALIDGVVLTPRLAINAGDQAQAVAVFTQDNRVEQITVSIDLQTDRLQDVRLELVSPGGTRSILIDEPPSLRDGNDEPLLPTNLRYTLNTVRNWGESLEGEWTLRVTNAATGAPVTLNNWSIKAYAADSTAPTVQIFTDEFATFAARNASRLSIESADGADLNASAVTADLIFDLSGGTSQIDGVEVLLADPQAFHGLFAGDGNDRLIGNALDNQLMGGRGSNLIDGSAGYDYALYAATKSTIVGATKDANGIVTIRTKLGVDTLTNIEEVSFVDDSFTTEYLLTQYSPPTYQTNLGNVPANIYTGEVGFLQLEMLGTSNNDSVTGAATNDFVNLLGGDDSAVGGAGQDVLDGGVGFNFLTGGSDADTFFLDGRSGINTWSTITDFAPEDNVNIWGWQQGTSQLILALDGEGPAGFEGATFHYDLNGDRLIDTSITFSNLVLASLPNPTAEEIAGNEYLLFA
jgi:subtilisin-like proprotein convertase family protein